MQSLERKKRKESFEWWLSFREEVSTAATWRRSVTWTHCNLGDFFLSLSIFSFVYRQCGREGRRQDKMVLEMDQQVWSIDMVDCKAQSGGGDWNGHQDDNFPNDFWTQFSFIFSCFLNCISYNWCRDSFSSLWCWNPHTLTLDIQDERILVRCCPNNDNLRLDISWWTSPSEFLVV